MAGSEMVLPFLFSNYQCLLYSESRESLLKYQDCQWIYWFKFCIIELKMLASYLYFWLKIIS